MSTSHPVRKIPPALTDIEYYILTAILNRPRHGIGIFEDVARFTENQLVLSPGTLYAALKRMFAAGWVTMVDPSDAGYEPDERRKIYRATDAGAHAVVEKADWFEHELARVHTILLERQQSGSSGLGKADPQKALETSGQSTSLLSTATTI